MNNRNLAFLKHSIRTFNIFLFGIIQQMKKVLFCVILLVPLVTNGQPKVNLNDRCKGAYEDILSLKFKEATLLLEKEKTDNNDNLYVPYLENYIDFLKVFISEDYDLFTLLEENKSERIDRIKQLDENSPYRNFMLGNINLQWAVARLKFQEYFTAAFEINRAYRLLEENNDKFPDFVPNEITLGVLHIMIGLVPEKYRWILDIINMEGSVEEGKNELHLVLEHTMKDSTYSYLKDETLFYLGFVELNIYPDKNQLDFLLSQLELAGKENLLLDYLTINILMKNGNNDKVLNKFDSLPDLKLYYPFEYLHYLEGESLLRKLEANQAAEFFGRFIDNFRGLNYIKDAYRKLAWSFLITGDTLGYQETIIQVIDNGNTYVGQDKDAEREAQSSYIPYTDLIKTRLLFDGGYYQQADSILDHIDTTALRSDEKIERIYRKARIAHQTNKIETAKRFYKKTIEQGQNSSRYFAGNSALKLGEIYEEQEDLAQAKHFYRVCINLNFDEYESGIHTKAKAALKRISNQD